MPKECFQANLHAMLPGFVLRYGASRGFSSFRLTILDETVVCAFDTCDLSPRTFLIPPRDLGNLQPEPMVLIKVFQCLRDVGGFGRRLSTLACADFADF